MRKIKRYLMRMSSSVKMCHFQKGIISSCCRDRNIQNIPLFSHSVLNGHSYIIKSPDITTCTLSPFSNRLFPLTKTWLRQRAVGQMKWFGIWPGLRISIATFTTFIPFLIMAVVADFFSEKTGR